MQNRVGLFRAYGAFWKHYADFGNRTPKEAFWKAWAVHSAIVLALMAPIYYVYYQIVEDGNLSASLWILPLVGYSFAAVVPTIAIILRRLHDIDRNGCWFFLYLIPFAGPVIFFIMLSRPSAPFDVFPGRSGQGPYGFGFFGFYAPPRRFAPLAGGNSATAVIVVSMIIAVVFMVYSNAANSYIQKNKDEYFSTVFGDPILGNMWGDAFGNNGGPGGGYYGGGGSWEDDDSWLDDDEYWWDDDEYWWDEDDGYGWEYDDDPYLYGDYLTEEEIAAIDLVRDSSLEGFPDFAIEQVLLACVDEFGLLWDCESDLLGEEKDVLVTAWGTADGSFEFVCADFFVYEDGSIALSSLSYGDRVEYEKDALVFYAELYDVMEFEGAAAC